MLITKNNVERRLAEAGYGIVAEDLYGVTTVLNVMDKPGLVPWASRLAADAFKTRIRRARTLDELRDLLDVDGYQLAETYKGQRAERGSDLHGAAEVVAMLYQQGLRELEPHQVATLCFLFRLDDEKAWLLGAFWNWLLFYTPRVRATERPVVCLHCGYAATEDLEVWFRGDVWTLDTKSGGIFDTGALQTVAQAHAALNTDPAWKITRRTKWGAHRYNVEGAFVSGAREHVVEPAGRTGLLWLDPNADPSQPFSAPGVQIFETRNGRKDLEAFQHVLAAWKWRRAADCWVGQGPGKNRKAKK